MGTLFQSIEIARLDCLFLTQSVTVVLVLHLIKLNNPLRTGKSAAQ